MPNRVFWIEFFALVTMPQLKNCCCMRPNTARNPFQLNQNNHIPLILSFKTEAWQTPKSIRNGASDQSAKCWVPNTKQRNNEQRTSASTISLVVTVSYHKRFEQVTADSKCSPFQSARRKTLTEVCIIFLGKLRNTCRVVSSACSALLFSSTLSFGNCSQFYPVVYNECANKNISPPYKRASAQQMFALCTPQRPHTHTQTNTDFARATAGCIVNKGCICLLS